MANTNTDYVRDPVVDANPDLTRKRQRLSEEADETSPPSTKEDIIIEEVPMEEDGSSLAAAIELHDDLDGRLLAPFSDAFLITDNPMTPLQQIEYLRHSLLAPNSYMESHFFAVLSTALNNHVAQAQALPDLGRTRYLDEQDFFDKLGELCFRILARPTIFRKGLSDDKREKPAVLESINDFMQGINDMCLNVIDVLPMIMESMSTRRDSGSIKEAPQRNSLLWFIRILGQSLADNQAGVFGHFKDFGSKPTASRNERQHQFVNYNGATDKLVLLLQKLAKYNKRLLNDAWDDQAWEAVSAILHVLDKIQVQEIDHIHTVLRTLHEDILPIICNRKKQSLPLGLHELSMNLSEKLLQQLLANADVDSVAQIYTTYIKNDEDALLPHPINGRSLTQQLLDISDGEVEIQRHLVSASWFLQQMNRLLHSDIMDLRNYGISQMDTRLPDYFRACQALPQRLEHPVLTYIARFLRSNEVVRYIFGPNSHSSLINYSRQVVGFLAAVSNYTDQETDLIWHTCTESVEIEKAKASWTLLTTTCAYLDVDQLLHLAELYARTAPAKLSKDIVESLESLFATISRKSTNGSSKDEYRLKTAFISIDIMLNLGATADDALSQQLRHSAGRELRRYTTSDYTPTDRHEIYSRCVKSLKGPPQDATTATNILNILLLNVAFSPGETQDLIGMLSVRAAVEELGRFVRTCRDLPDRNAQHLAIAPRLTTILQLVALSGEAMSAEIEKLMFDSICGASALDNQARDLAWTFLTNASKGTPQLFDVVSGLLDHFLNSLAINVPLKHTTPQLVRLLGASLTSPKNSHNLKDEVAMLDSANWRRLVDSAEFSADDRVRQIAACSIRQILCEPNVQLPDGMTAAKLQAEFARRHIQRICEEAAKSSSSSGLVVCRQLDLLDVVLQASREHPAYLDSKADTKICLASDNTGNLLQFRLQLYRSGQLQPTVFHVQAESTTTLQALEDELPAHSGATEHRVILSGKLVDLARQANESLAAIGLQSSGVMQICPKYTIQSDLNTLMTPVGAIEDTIMSHYDQLERLLDGTEEIARRTYDLLKQIRPPKQARDRVTSLQTPVNELCPASSRWRTLMTVYVLRTHLLDFANMGVVDRAFFVCGTRILITVLMDSDRRLDPPVYVQVLDCLVAFLQERADSITDIEIVSEPSRFVTRMIDMCTTTAAEQPSTPDAVLTESVYKTLLHAFQQQPKIWDSYAADSRVGYLHRQLLSRASIQLYGKVCAMIETFCKSSSIQKQVASFYLDIILGLVPDALEVPSRATEFFRLATSILHAVTTLPSDEARARGIMDMLVSALWRYRHTETPNFPPVDPAIAGLLQLLGESIQIVRSAKKPIALDGFALHVSRRLLFPPSDSTEWRTLLDEQSRSTAFQLVKATCETEDDFYGLVTTAFAALQETVPDPAQKYPGRDKFLRSASDHSGLFNLRNTCYMNSLLQQLFANTKFRQFIFSIPIEDGPQETVLAAVSSLFAYMQDGYFSTTDPGHLAKLLNIDVWIQEDVHTFYENFLARLEADMPNAEYKAQLDRFYTGNLVSQIRGTCGHVSSRLEEFVDIPIVITNQQDLAGSLEAYVQGERMEGQNQYRCATCDPSTDGRLVDAMKRSCIEDLPDNVTFCLKRFSFEAMFGGDASKENGRFEFPQTIDLGKYTREHLEGQGTEKDENVFELVGVIVHWGTLTSGHYWSYTLVRNTASPESRKWVRLNDSSTETVTGGLHEVQQECFGGGLGFDNKLRQDNAYVLFYQRKTSLQEPVAIATPLDDASQMDPMPARVSLPAALAAELHSKNMWHQRIAQLFDDDLCSFLAWTVENFSRYTTGVSSPSDVSDSPSEAKALPKTDDQMDDKSDNRVTQAMGDLAAAYIQRVIVCQPVPWKKQGTIVPGLKKLISEHRIVAATILNRIVEESQWFNKIIAHDKRSARMTTYDLIMACLVKLKSTDHETYAHNLRQLVNIHSSFIQPGLNLALEADFITFAAEVARLGAEEMAFILDEGYYTWAMGLLFLPLDPKRQEEFPGLWQHFITRETLVSALYDFVYLMVSAQPDIAAAPDKPLGDVHAVTVSGVSLHREEFGMLVERGDNDLFCWMSSARNAIKPTDWRSSSPGKLLSLLCKVLPSSGLDMIEASLTKYIQQEEDSFATVMNLVLHYLSCDLPKERTLPVCNALGKTVTEWQEIEEEFLGRLKDAYDFAPLALLASTKIWLYKLLSMHGKRSIRTGTLRFLDQDVFIGPAISNYDELDVARTQLAMSLVCECGRLLKQAYNKEYARAKWDQTITAGRTAAQHLHDLRDEAAKLRKDLREDEEDPVSDKLQIWLDEVPRLIQAWAQLEQDVLGDWSQEDEMDVGAGTRESVEVSDDGYTSDEYDEEMEDDEP